VQWIRHEGRYGYRSVYQHIIISHFSNDPADPWTTQRFNFKSSSDSVKDQTMYLGSHVKPKTNNYESFQYYHRLSGSTPHTPHIAVDIDFYNNEWRIMELSGADEVNKWIAYDRVMPLKGQEGLAKLPVLWKFNPISEKRVMNGTFTNVDSKYKHMYIPELDLAIANMDSFISNYYLEPFIRIFNVFGLDDDVADKMMDAEWNNKPNERVVMRTAAFGHGRSGLSMCIKEGGMREWFGFEGSDGILNERLVPFAIIATLRTRVNETGIRALYDTN